MELVVVVVVVLWGVVLITEEAKCVECWSGVGGGV